MCIYNRLVFENTFSIKMVAPAKNKCYTSVSFTDIELKLGISFCQLNNLLLLVLVHLYPGRHCTTSVLKTLSLNSANRGLSVPLGAPVSLQICFTVHLYSFHIFGWLLGCMVVQWLAQQVATDGWMELSVVLWWTGDLSRCNHTLTFWFLT